MKRNILLVGVFLAAGAAVGALLGYGPLLKYRSVGVLSLEIDTSEYKRFSELANNAATLRQFAAAQPSSDLDADDLQQLQRTIADGGWTTPIPTVSKADAREIPEMLLKLERDKDSDVVRAYLGVQLTYANPDPQRAAQITTWLGGYFKDVAAREALRERVFAWAGDSRRFMERAQADKLKFQFEIEQNRARVKALKVIVSSYPEVTRRDAGQIVDVRKDNEKFISPLAQLIGAESEIIEINRKVQKLDREMEQHEFAQELIENAEAALRKARSGSEGVLAVSKMIVEFSRKAKSDAEKEKLLSLAAEVSQIGARFLARAQFVAEPAVPTRPERPRPLMVVLVFAFLSAVAGVAYAWRDLLLKKPLSPQSPGTDVSLKRTPLPERRN